MIKPLPSLKKCLKCGKIFLYMPKSDCLSPVDWICNQCKNPKGAKKGLFEKIFNPKSDEKFK